MNCRSPLLSTTTSLPQTIFSRGTAAPPAALVAAAPAAEVVAPLDEVPPAHPDATDVEFASDVPAAAGIATALQTAHTGPPGSVASHGGADDDERMLMTKNMATLSDVAESVTTTTAPVAEAPDSLGSNACTSSRRCCRASCCHNDPLCSAVLSGVTDAADIDNKTLFIDLPAEPKMVYAEASSSADDVVNVAVTVHFLAVSHLQADYARQKVHNALHASSHARSASRRASTATACLRGCRWPPLRPSKTNRTR